jgi:hypothetical protein
VILPDANHASPPRIDDAIRIPQRIRSGASWSWGEGAGRPACILPIEPLVDIVREIDHAAGHNERAASILVRACANAESVGVVRSHEFRFSVRADAVDESSSLFLRLSLAPIDRFAVERDLLEADRVSDDEVRGYGRRPKTKGARSHDSRPVRDILTMNCMCTPVPQAICSAVYVPGSFREGAGVRTHADQRHPRVKAAICIRRRKLV